MFFRLGEQIGILILVLVCFSTVVFAQNVPVYQTGKTTRGHPSVWMAPGVQGDAGGPGNGVLTGVGITNTGLPNCINDVSTSAPGGYHQLCFGANATVGTATSPSGGGGGSAVGPASSNIGDCAVWANTSGNLLSDAPCSVSLTTLGAACDNSTDDTIKINVALASGFSSLYVPPGRTCYAASQITVPDGVTLFGANFVAQPTQKSGIRSGVTTGPAIVAGANDNGDPEIHDLQIFGNNSGGTTCIKWYGTANVHPRNLWCQGFGYGYQIVSDGPFGIYFHGDHLYTCGITQADGDIVGEPGVYLDHPVFGCTGAFDVAHSAYLRVEGNWDPTVGTIHLTEPQFNLGQAVSLTCAVQFQGFTGTTNVITDVEIIGGHEEVAQNAFCSDATVKGISLFQVNGTWFDGGWGGANHFFSLNSAATLNTWEMVGMSLTGWGDVTLAPTAQFNDIKFVGDSFLMPVNITGVGSSTLEMGGNTYDGVTLAGSFGTARVAGHSQGGAYSSAGATGSIEFDVPGPNQTSLQNCSVGFAAQIGGSSTGITYTQSPVCQWQLVGNYASASIYVSITSTGGLSGALSFTGLPYNAATSNIGCAAIYSPQGLLSASNGVVLCAGAAGKTINAYTPNSTGQTPVTNSNLNCSSGTPCIFAGTLVYPVSGTP